VEYWSNTACSSFTATASDPNMYASTAIWQPSPDYEPIPTPTKIECAWCGQVNNSDREQCRGCGAPLTTGVICQP